MLIKFKIHKINELLKNKGFYVEHKKKSFNIFHSNKLLMSIGDKIDGSSFMQILLVLHDVKPAYWGAIEKNSRYSIQYVNYETLDEIGLNCVLSDEKFFSYSGKGRIILFSKEKIKNKSTIKGLFESRAHEEIGEILGFPPAAIKDFMMKNKSNRKIAVDYFGFRFTVTEANLEDALSYMKKEYEISSELKKINSLINKNLFSFGLLRAA